MKQKKMEKNIIENHQTKMSYRNTRKNNGDIEQPENKRKMAVLSPHQ